MAYLNNVRDGRQSKVYLLSFGTTELTSVTKGHVYAVAVKGASTTLGDLEVGDIFVAVGTFAIGTNDKVVEVTPKFLGGATDKDISFEKSTTDITCDKDDANNIVSNGIVSSSGTINCMDLLETGDTAANIIKQRFNKMVTYDATTGAPTVSEKDRTEKDMLMFVWDARELNTGEYIGIDIVPAFLTSQAHGSAYGSGQTFTINFSGADTDEHGHRRSYQQFAYFDEFGAQLDSWT